jgi:hypothetical protein
MTKASSDVRQSIPSGFVKRTFPRGIAVYQQSSLFASTNTIAVLRLVSEHRHTKSTRNFTVYKYVREHYPISKELVLASARLRSLCPNIGPPCSYFSAMLKFQLRTSWIASNWLQPLEEQKHSGRCNTPIHRKEFIIRET